MLNYLHYFYSIFNVEVYATNNVIKSYIGIIHSKPIWSNNNQHYDKLFLFKLNRITAQENHIAIIKIFLDFFIYFLQFLVFTKSCKIVIFKSLRKCKGRNTENFTFKFNSNKIMLCGDVGQYYFV